MGNRIGEVEHGAPSHEQTDIPPAPDRLRILFAGELTGNAERLFGLWTPNPYWYNTAGPPTFGPVLVLEADHRQGEIHRINPDLSYALLNWQAVPFDKSVRFGIRSGANSTRSSSTPT